MTTLNVKGKQRVNLFLDPILVKKAKMLAVDSNISLSALIEEALKDKIPKQIIYSPNNNYILGDTKTE
jgi:hypothetical protein